MLFLRTMKKILQISILVILFMGISQIRVQAQATITAQVFAEVIAAITATETSQLNFGRFSPETAGGEVQITPQGGRLANGTVILVSGTHNPASFYITGESDATFSIALPTAVTITNLNNSKTMHVTDWSSTPPAGIGVGSLHGGSQIVSVGATLKVGTINDNPTGIYEGTYTVTFGYN
jgi:hypothetical protein